MSTTSKAFFDSPEGAVELFGFIPMRASEFRNQFPGVKTVKYDSFSFAVGHIADRVDSAVMPITRLIKYKSSPSLHECSAKCRNGKCNGVCECQCGGKNHGVASVG